MTASGGVPPSPGNRLANASASSVVPSSAAASSRLGFSEGPLSSFEAAEPCPGAFSDNEPAALSSRAEAPAPSSARAAPGEAPDGGPLLRLGLRRPPSRPRSVPPRYPLRCGVDHRLARSCSQSARAVLRLRLVRVVLILRPRGVPRGVRHWGGGRVWWGPVTGSVWEGVCALSLSPFLFILIFISPSTYGVLCVR